MAIIVPAILEDSVEKFNDKLAEVLVFPELKRAQIDVSDGKFTLRRTVQLSEIDVLSPVVEWEAHLMVESPEEHFLDAKIAGISTVVIHLESPGVKDRLPQLVAKLNEYKMKAALAIKPETSIDEAVLNAELFDHILLLEVHPGYQGQQMDSATIERIRTLRDREKNVIIEVDGGVKSANAKELAAAGADLLVVGSAINEFSGALL